MTRRVTVAAANPPNRAKEPRHAAISLAKAKAAALEQQQAARADADAARMSAQKAETEKLALRCAQFLWPSTWLKRRK